VVRVNPWNRVGRRRQIGVAAVTPVTRFACGRLFAVLKPTRCGPLATTEEDCCRTNEAINSFRTACSHGPEVCQVGSSRPVHRRMSCRKRTRMSYLDGSSARISGLRARGVSRNSVDPLMKFSFSAEPLKAASWDRCTLPFTRDESGHQVQRWRTLCCVIPKS
jgi:hypothetical protein